MDGRQRNSEDLNDNRIQQLKNGNTDGYNEETKVLVRDYKGGKEFEENLRMLNEEHVRKYNLLQQQSPQTEEEFRRQVEESHRLSEERKKKLSEA